MLRPRYRWQLIVFVGAILLPSAALVVVGQRTLQQNRELVRLADERAARERIAREMLARLENLKRTATLTPPRPIRLSRWWRPSSRGVFCCRGSPTRRPAGFAS